MTGWQEPVALIVVALTAVLFIRRSIRSRRRARSCGSDCACGGLENGSLPPTPDTGK